MAEFSLALNDDQQQIKQWVHDFAATVVRPAAHEWDEREEFPRPVVQEAAKIGLYSFDFFAQASMGDNTGLTLPITLEELFWGDAGIGLAIFGSGLAAAGIAGNGTPEQVVEWVPQCFGSGPDDLMIGAYCVSEPDAGSDVSSLKTRAVYEEANDEWVLNGTRAWATNGGLADTHAVTATVDPSLGSRGQASFIVPKGTKGISQGQKYKKHGIRASHTAEVVLDDCRIPGRCLLGGKEKLDERLAGAKEGRRSRGQAAMRTFEASRPAVGAQAIGIARAAYEYALDYAKTREQFAADERRDARRAQLLDAAERVVEHRGSDASMAQIAAEAGITKPILYRHFGDKADLYRALAERLTGELLVELRAALATRGTLRDRTRATID